MKFINSLSVGILCSFLLAVCFIYPSYVFGILPPITYFKWFLLIFVSYFTLKQYRKEHHEYTISAKAIVLGGLLFLPLIIANLCYELVQISHHGWYHNGYVLQILQDIYPLKNVNAPGLPTTTYWSFHYLVATFSEAFHYPSFRVNAALNCFALYVCFVLIDKILRELKVKPSGVWYFALMLIVLFNGDPFGSFSFIGNVLAFDLDVFSFDMPWQAELWMIPYLPVKKYFIIQLTTMYSKFFNFSGVPLGVASFLFSLYNMILFRKKMDNQWILLISCAGTFFIHTTIGLFTLFALPLALCIEFLINGRLDELWNFAKKNILFIIVAAFYAGLVVYYLLSASTVFGASKITVFRRLIWNMYSLLLFNAPLVVFTFFATKYGKNIDLKRHDARFLIILFLIGGLMSWFISIHVANQYKFMYLTSIVAGFLFALWVNNRKWILFITVLIFCNLQIINYGFHFSKIWSSFENTIKFEGAYSIGSQMTTWIRENSPKDAVVLAPMNILNSEDFVHSGRLPYIREDWAFMSGAPLEDRTIDVTSFYAPQNTAQEQAQLAEKILEKSQSTTLTILLPQEIKLSFSDRFQKAKSFDEFDIYVFE